MVLENREFEIKNTIKCNCGHEFEVKEITSLKRINQDGFYGNNVKHYSFTNCPVCGKEVILLLKQVGQTYKVIDTAVEKVKNTSTEATTDVEEKIEVNNELICPVCGKACKSQLGLNSHLKTHQNN